MLVYSPRTSNRLLYILKTLLHQGLGLDFTITQDRTAFEQSPHVRINYSNLEFDFALNIKPHTILFDHGIKDYHLEVNSHSRFYKLFFRNNNGIMPFDLLGAAFWLLSRYEEYLPHKTDAHNRFHYSSSLAYQYDFLEVPLVNLWLEQLGQLLCAINSDLTLRKNSYSFLSTIDIDSVYKYKFKGFVRTLAGFVSDGSLAKMKERLNIILNRAKDPFDCYDFLINCHKKQNINALYFFLLGDYGPNDKNHSATDLRFQSLIKHLADYSAVGIHPSYGSNDNQRQLKVEISRLANIMHRIVTKSRQHFSVLRFPKTYQNLLQAGIFADYSMGYTNQNGFRASYCFPYQWYSLDIEALSALTIHSFCISENTLLNHSLIKHKGFFELAMPIVNEVKHYGGEMISIFHNDNFNDKMEVFYCKFLELANA